MREACKRASISPAIGVHALRHSWASQAVMGGMPLLLVAENLGHSDTRMVEKHYGHLTDDYRDEMFAKHAPRLGTVETTNVVPMKEKA
jgi:integrase